MFLEGVLRRDFREGTWKAETRLFESTNPVSPLRAPCLKGVAVTTEIAMSAETAKTFKTVLILKDRQTKKESKALSFFSLVFLFPWCFSCCELPWSLGLFSGYFPGFLRVRKVREILGVFEVFLGIFEKTKEKKDRGCSPEPQKPS